MFKKSTPFIPVGYKDRTPEQELEDAISASRREGHIQEQRAQRLAAERHEKQLAVYTKAQHAFDNAVTGGAAHRKQAEECDALAKKAQETIDRLFDEGFTPQSAAALVVPPAVVAKPAKVQAEVKPEPEPVKKVEFINCPNCHERVQKSQSYHYTSGDHRLRCVIDPVRAKANGLPEGLIQESLERQAIEKANRE